MARTSAHPSQAAAWWSPLKHALEQPGPALLLVEDARLEALGELVEALLPGHPELEVHTGVERLRDMPEGSVHVLVPREKDAEALLLHQTHLEQRGLRVVLFCVPRTLLALERWATDVLALARHRVRCPRRAPRFAVAGLRQALAVRAPGVVWTGGDLRAAFAAARPRSGLRELSAARPYEALLAEVRAHPRAWLAWTDVDCVERLRRVRWVLAEARHRTRAILVEPAVPSPGWWPVHGRLEDLRTSRERLEKQGATLPGQMAALNHLEPEALEALLAHGAQAPTIEAAVHFLNAPEGPADPSLKEMRRRYAHVLFQGDVEPYIARMFPAGQLRAMCREERAATVRRMEAGHPVEAEDFASWVAWTCAQLRPETSGPDLARLVSRPPEHVAEWLLASRTPAPEVWSRLAAWAHEQGDTEMATRWAHRARSTSTPGP